VEALSDVDEKQRPGPRRLRERYVSWAETQIITNALFLVNLLAAGAFTYTYIFLVRNGCYFFFEKMKENVYVSY
jgi:hypothetical protein